MLISGCHSFTSPKHNDKFDESNDKFDESNGIWRGEWCQCQAWRWSVWVVSVIWDEAVDSLQMLQFEYKIIK